MGGAAASPLAEIERTVQERAKDISLEMAAPGGEAKLRALIADEVARWNDDHRRGRRAFALPDPDLVVERAFRNLARYGPLTPLLADDDVWEVMVNAPDAVFVRRHQGPSGYHDEVFHDDDHVLRTLTKLLDDASTAHRSLDPAEGLQDAQLDDGARVHIVHGDIARGGHVLVNIRKFTGIPFRSLGELVERDMLTAQVAALLAACVRARLSIVFAGPPGSGKTTLLSCTTAELDPSLRVVVAEEVFESDIPVPNVAQMQTRAARSDRPGVDLRRLVAGFLRMAPDVAVVGEVRDREALPLLLTLSSGVTGYTTIHAGSARQALTRLRFICQLADTSGGLPLAALNSLVSESIDVVVQCARTAAGPRVTEVVMVEDLAGGADATHFTVTEVFRRPGARPGAGVDGRRAGACGAGAGRRGPRRPEPARGAGSTAVTGLLLAACAAAGVFYVYTALVLGWRGLGPGPAAAGATRRRGRGADDWLVQAGLAGVDVRQFGLVTVALAVGGARGGARAVRRTAAGARPRWVPRRGAGRVVPGPPGAAAGGGAGVVAADHRGDPDPDLLARPVGAAGAVRGGPGRARQPAARVRGRPARVAVVDRLRPHGPGAEGGAGRSDRRRGVRDAARRARGRRHRPRPSVGGAHRGPRPRRAGAQGRAQPAGRRAVRQALHVARAARDGAGRA